MYESNIIGLNLCLLKANYPSQESQLQ